MLLVPSPPELEVKCHFDNHTIASVSIVFNVTVSGAMFCCSEIYTV